MRYTVRLFLLLICICGFAMQGLSQRVKRASDDTLLNKNSGIKLISTDKDRIKTLTNLGMLWGFIKYHHPNVKAGEYNMDAELFRVLPKVLAGGNAEEADKIMEMWVGHFGAVQRGKAIFYADSIIKLKADYGYLFDADNFSEKFRNKLEVIKTGAPKKDGEYVSYYAGYAMTGQVEFKNELAYATEFPDAGTRLLSLYRYWNIIQYFYPYRYLLKDNWNQVLSEFIPVFCEANDTKSYVRACERLLSRIDDMHGGNGGPLVNKAHKGYKTVPFRAEFLEGKLVVIKCYDTLGYKELLRPGDVIEEVDGLSIEQQINRALPVMNMANYSSKLWAMAMQGGEIFCQPDSLIRLKIDRYGMKKTVALPRVGFDRRISKYLSSPFISDTGYKIIDNNIGYIYPAKLSEFSMDSLKAKLNNTKGLIMDLRCYPATFMPFVFGAWLKCAPTPFVRIGMPCIGTPGQFTDNMVLSCGGRSDSCYKGKLVILADQNTGSQAEYTTMALATVPNSVVIGDTTKGSDGDVADVILPGPIYTRISGIGILYPDGGETQRVGVRIDKFVRPTIKGRLAEKDEVLETGINIINNR